MLTTARTLLNMKLQSKFKVFSLVDQSLPNGVHRMSRKL